MDEEDEAPGVSEDSGMPITPEVENEIIEHKSESGRTYTVSEKSEGEKLNENGDNSLQITCIQNSATIHDLSTNSDSLSQNKKEQIKNSVDDQTETTLKLQTIIPKTILESPDYSTLKNGNLSPNLNEKNTDKPLDFIERSFSLDFDKTQTPIVGYAKTRSTSLYYRNLRTMSSSEIANKYLPDSLKNLIVTKEEEDLKEVQSDISSKSESTCSSSRFATPTSSKAPNKYSSSSHRSSSDVSRTRVSPLRISPNSPNRSVSSCPVHGHKRSSLGAWTPPSKVPPNPATRRRKTASLNSTNPLNVSTPSSTSSDNELICGICAQRFKNPKLLPCLHSFCEECLIHYTPGESLTLTCPTCRQQSILPKDGVYGLKQNKCLNVSKFHKPSRSNATNQCSKCSHKSTMSCIKCNIILCNKCVHHHDEDSSSSDSHSVTSLEESTSQASPGDPFSPVHPIVLYCSSHPGQTLRFFCRDCGIAVCSSCTDTEHRHHVTSHLDHVVVHDSAEDLRRMVEKVTLQLPCMKEALCDLNDALEQLEANKSKSEAEISDCFRGLHEILNQRQNELVDKLHQQFQSKKNAIESQREELDKWVTGVETSCEYAENSISDLPPMEAVLVKKQLEEKLHSFADVEFPPIPRDNPHVNFVEGNMEFMKNSLKNLGRIQANSAVPQQTTAIGDNLKRIFVERQCVVTVVTRDHKGNRITTGGAEVKASVNKNISLQNGHHHTSNGDLKNSIGRTCKIRKDTSEAQVIDLNNGTYEVFFTVFSIGTYTLALFLYGQHISASPFILSARMPTDAGTWCEAGSVHRDENNMVRRKSSTSMKVCRKSSSGSNIRPHSHKSSCSRRTLREPIEDDLVLRVGTRGRNKGEFVNPQGICFAPVKDGRILVADSNNQCIQVFDTSGECRIKFGIRGRSVGQLQRPTGVTPLPDGNYAVADYENKWVSIFEPTGKYVRRIGHGKLLGPKGLCVNNEGNLIVVDNKASCIFIFSQSGKLLNKFGNRSLEGYNFAGPHFCAVNSSGDIIITDFHNHCVRVFSSDGVAKFTFGTNGEGNGQFNAPTGVAVDANHNIIVADWGNSRIQIFDSQGSFLSFVNTLADPLYGPQGLSLTADGHIVVADSGNHCFKLYKYLQ